MTTDGSSPQQRRTPQRIALAALALGSIALLGGCNVAFETALLAMRVAQVSEHNRDAPPPVRRPVADSLSEDARFVASRIASCPLDETRIVRRARHRFTAVGCDRVVVLRCRVPDDGSPTRCREVHPPERPVVAAVRATDETTATGE